MATALDRAWQIMGLRFLFAPIPSMLWDDLPREFPQRKKDGLIALAKYLGEVSAGIGLLTLRRRKQWHRYPPLAKAVELERAYCEMRPLLSQDRRAAKKLLGDLQRVSTELAQGKWPNARDRVMLQSFCRRALRHLEREAFENGERLRAYFP